MGLPVRLRSIDGFLLGAQGMRLNEKLGMAVAVYALARTLSQLRDRPSGEQLRQILRLHVCEGLRGSKARSILRAQLSS